MGNLPMSMGKNPSDCNFRCGLNPVMTKDWRRNLKRLIEEKATSMKRLSLDAGLGETFVRDAIERHRTPSTENMHRLAHSLGVSVAEIMGQDWSISPSTRPEALVVGYVGAGAEVHRFEDGVVLESVEAPPSANGYNAARIRGDSQFPLQDGWLIFYGPEHQGVGEDCEGELCVVEVKNGPTLLKTLRRGSKKGLWRLESWNAPPKDDVQVAWAARVTHIGLNGHRTQQVRRRA